MQIGADIFCDTTCIISELERRYPDPVMIPSGMPASEWHLGGANDVELFKTAIAVVFSDGLEHMPPGFAEDRTNLYFDGANEDSYFQDRLSANLDIIGAYFERIETAVSTQKFIGGDVPSVRDAVGYYIAWFLRGRFSGGPDFIASFPHLVEWESRIRDIGHGQEVDYADDAALQDAAHASPDKGLGILTSDTDGMTLGDIISVRPDDDKNTSTGALITLTDDRVSISRHDEILGETVVHFPRAGYVIENV